MNKFSNETSGRGACTRARLGRHLHHHHHHHHHRHHAVREFHQALANVARSGNEQLRGEAAQIVAEATARLNGLLGAQR